MGVKREGTVAATVGTLSFVTKIFHKILPSYYDSQLIILNTKELFNYRYKEQFEHYPPNRKALIPYIW